MYLFFEKPYLKKQIERNKRDDGILCCTIINTLEFIMTRREINNNEKILYNKMRDTSYDCRVDCWRRLEKASIRKQNIPKHFMSQTLYNFDF